MPPMLPPVSRSSSMARAHPVLLHIGGDGQAVHRLEHLLQGGGVDADTCRESSSMVYRRSRCSVSSAWISWITLRLLGAVPGQLPPAGLQPLQIQQQLLELQPEIGQPPHLRLPVQGPEDLLQLRSRRKGEGPASDRTFPPASRPGSPASRQDGGRRLRQLGQVHADASALAYISAGKVHHGIRAAVRTVEATDRPAPR